MAIQYDRVIRVSVGGLLIEHLRIDFETSATSDDAQNTGEVTIYNLSRSRYEQIAERGDRILLEAGYRLAGDPAVIFSGTTQRIWKARGDTAFLTKIALGDALRSSKVKGGVTGQTFAGEEPVRDIAAALVADMGLELGPMDAIPSELTRTDFRADGKPGDALRSLIDDVDGVSVIIDGDIVRFAAGNKPQPDSVRIVKTPRTGMIGVPEINEDGEVTIDMLLEPRARCGGEILIEGSEYIAAAPYTIVGVDHKASNWTGKFTTTVSAVDPNAQPEEDPDEEEPQEDA